MKLALTILATSTILGCSPERTHLPTAPSAPATVSAPTPTPPTPTPTSLTWLWVMVVDDTGVCIAGATIQVVRGQGLGPPIAQRTPCDAWAYDGGITFTDLTPGVEMTLRASAPGYAAQEKTVVPVLGPQMAVLLTPVRIQ